MTIKTVPRWQGDSIDECFRENPGNVDATFPSVDTTDSSVDATPTDPNPTPSSADPTNISVDATSLSVDASFIGVDAPYLGAGNYDSSDFASGSGKRRDVCETIRRRNFTANCANLFDGQCKRCKVLRKRDVGTRTHNLHG